MIAGTYILSGVMLAITAWLFDAGTLTATTQTIAWVVIFFFASAGASAAYLTVSEIYPMETRAIAIALFYAVGTGLGGIIGPVLFGHLIATKHPFDTAIGYLIGGGLMFAAGVVEIVLDTELLTSAPADVARQLGLAATMRGLRAIPDADVQRLVDRLRDALGNEAYEAAYAGGAAVPRDEAVAELRKRYVPDQDLSSPLTR